MSRDWLALNRANWEERTAVHLGPRGYDLSSQRAGRGRLDAIVEAELSNVRGLRILHLQSHLGDDSIALAQRGAAEVVGVDFSPAAIAAATALAAECAVPHARFVLSDVYGAPDALAGRAAGFDLVFTTWGTVGWLPDISRWAGVVAHFLRPGGSLFMADGHPAALVFDDVGQGAAEGRPGWLVPYFERAARMFNDPTDYMDEAARLANSRTVQWLHPLGDMMSALTGAGLGIAAFREYPGVPWRMFRSLVQGPDRLWTWPDQPWLPLSFSLRAVRG